MTRKEALEYLKSEFEDAKCEDSEYYQEWADALYMAIKALEQEPCEDAVSRTEVLNLVRFNAFHVKSQIKAIENMPPVTPQEPKIGHWLYIDERKAKCSQCGYIQITGGADKTGHCNIHYGVYKYCTNCGAKMED